MTTPVADHAPFDNLIRRIASEYARTYTMVEMDDILQNLYEWWYTPANTDYINGYINDDGEEGRRKLVRSLRNEAYKHCLFEKAQQEGYEPEDLQWYTADQVSDLLPVALDSSTLVYETPLVDTMGRSNVDPAEGNTRMAAVADVARALEQIDTEDRTFLAVVFSLNLDWDEIGRFFDILPDSAQKRYRRIVERVQRKLGGRRPDGWFGFVGSRRAMSNAAAIAITREQWSE